MSEEATVDGCIGAANALSARDRDGQRRGNRQRQGRGGQRGGGQQGGGRQQRGHQPRGQQGQRQQPRGGGPPPGGPGGPGGRPPRDDSGIGRRTILGVFGLTGAVGIGWYLLDDSGGSSDESEIRNVLQRQARALEGDDLDTYMDTLHPESPVYDESQQTTEALMEEYDLQIDLQIDEIQVDGDEAEVDVTQETRIAESDPDFQENRSEIVHDCRPYEGEWRVYNSTLVDREPL